MDASSARAVVPPPRPRSKCVAFSAALHLGPFRAATGAVRGLAGLKIPANPCTTSLFSDGRMQPQADECLRTFSGRQKKWVTEGRGVA